MARSQRIVARLSSDGRSVNAGTALIEFRYTSTRSLEGYNSASPYATNLSFLRTSAQLSSQGRQLALSLACFTAVAATLRHSSGTLYRRRLRGPCREFDGKSVPASADNL